jgi:hypothetical protein
VSRQPGSRLRWTRLRSNGQRWSWRRWLVVVVLLSSPLWLHLAVVSTTSMQPPTVASGRDTPVAADDDPKRLELDGSYRRKRGRIWEVRLNGSPERIGRQHVALLYDELVTVEQAMHQAFDHYVPFGAAQTLLVDLARLRFSHLDETLGAERRTEIAAFAAGFQPDPFESLMPAYQRFVFLNSLYDIMLSFERSPLVGCSSLVLTGEAVRGGHTLLARNFDMEGPRVLDDNKAVFLVFEEGRVPFASVSWPGFIGVTSGMNAAGVAVVIHGARAGEPRAEGEPVTQTVRSLLATTTNLDEALTLLESRGAMVSHMLMIADAQGNAAIVERVPGERPHVRRRSQQTLPLTNHLEGPRAKDPRNLEVVERTSTRQRRRRLDAIVENLSGPISVQRAVAILRDKKGPEGDELPMGHRHALDALIATHSVVMDTTARELWVSEGPHSAGRYLRFDLHELLDPGYRPTGPARVEAVPADDILDDGRYEAWRARGAPHEAP